MENILFKKKEYKVIEKLSDHEYYSSYKCSFKNKVYFVRAFANQAEFLADYNSYKELKKLGITMPKLLKKDKKSNVIIYEYIDGDNVAKHLAKEDLPDEYFSMMFNMYRFARFSKFELDYNPINYVVKNNTLYYLSHVKKKQNQEINFENYGINFWLMSKEGYENLKQLGFEVDSKRVVSKGDVNKKIVLLSIMKW